MRAEQTDRITSLDLLITFLLMLHKIQLAFRAASPLMAHAESFINSQSQIFLHKSALKLFSTKQVFVLEIVLTQVQYLVLDIFQLHEIGMSPQLKPVQVPLNETASL